MYAAMPQITSKEHEVTGKLTKLPVSVGFKVDKFGVFDWLLQVSHQGVGWHVRIGPTKVGWDAWRFSCQSFEPPHLQKLELPVLARVADGWEGAGAFGYGGLPEISAAAHGGAVS